MILPSDCEYFWEAFVNGNLKRFLLFFLTCWVVDFFLVSLVNWLVACLTFLD